MRYTRHELKQDKFAESAVGVVHEVAEHRAGIIQIVVIVLVLVLFGGGIYWYVDSRETQAANALGEALMTYNAPVVPPGTPPQGGMVTFNSDQERLTEAKKAFYAISDQHGWTSSGQYARYLAGMTEEELGNDAVAEDQLRAISNSHRRELAALAKYGLATVYRHEKRDQDAINLLQTLIDKPAITVPKATARFALADLYVAQHQPEKAKVIYGEIAKDNPKSALEDAAKEHEGELK